MTATNSDDDSFDEGGCLIPDSSKTIQGNPAHEFLVRGTSQTILGQTIFANKRFILLLLLYTTDEEPQNLRRIFDTLQFEQPAPSTIEETPPTEQPVTEPAEKPRFF